jgi:hypothetical protein|tara:strand:+ start:135 stop:356 length:222 start_codon:yes stop_codon:yes gene_type:complete
MERSKKIIEQIPKDTLYCYTPTSKPGMMDDGRWGYTIDSCPFYEHVDGLVGHCKLLKCEVMDQVKECGENYGD